MHRMHSVRAASALRRVRSASVFHHSLEAVRHGIA